MSEFQVSNFEVFPPKCELLLFDTAQREDVSNQQGSFCLLWNTPEEEEEQLCMAKQLSLGSIPSDNGQENFKVWHLKLTRLTSHENMFCLRAFTGRCNRWYHRHEIKSQLPSYLPSQSFYLQQSSSYKKHTTTRLKNNIKMTMTYRKTYGRSFNQLWQTNIPAQSWNYLYTVCSCSFPLKRNFVTISWTF